MQTDQRPWLRAVVVALALTAPRAGMAQATAASIEAAATPRADSKLDCWYAEGGFQLLGQRYSLFAGASFTQFASAASRAAYGSGTLSPVIGLYRPSHRGFSPDFDFNATRIGVDGSTARILAATAGVNYRPVDAEGSRWFAPFFAAGVGPRIARTPSGSTTIMGGSARIGVEMRRSVRLSIRYDALPRVYGEHLSTVSIGATLRLPPYRSRASLAAPGASAEGCADSGDAERPLVLPRT